MNKAYSRTVWEDYPSVNSPVNQVNLNNIEKGVDEIDNRVVTLDTTKANKTEIAPLIKEISFDESNGIFTITRKDGSKFTIDTKMEKIAVNFTYNPTTQQIILTLIDGTKQYIDLSALITEYEFSDTDTVSFFIAPDGKVSASVKEGSIEEKHLRPNYLAEIKVEVAKAQASQQAAATSEANAAASATTASESETNAKKSEQAATTSASTATTKAGEASNSAISASNSASMATTKAGEAAASATAAATSETNAAASATTANSSAESALNSAGEATTKAEEAANSATLSKSWAVGDTGIRQGEDTDNSKYYSQLSKQYKEQSSQSAESAQDALEQINKKTELATFDIDDDGNLIYTDNSPYIFTVDDNGNLNWEVAA